MTTDFSTNVNKVFGSFAVSSTDTPLDIRQRVQTELDIMSIPNPWLGMIVYVEDTKKRYEVTKLKSVKLGMSMIENGAVADYQLIDSVTQEQISEMQNDIDNLEDADIFKASQATSTSLGGILAGDDLSGLSIQNILTKLLFPYVSPIIISNADCYPKDLLLEKGLSVMLTQINTSVKKGSEPIKKIAFLISGVEVYEIIDDVCEGGIFKYIPPQPIHIQRDLPVGYFQVAVTDTTDKVILSNIPTAKFIYPIYCGSISESDTVDTNLLYGLSKVISTKKGKDYTYNTNNQHMIMACPKEYGELESIIDSNGFNLINSFNKQEIEVDCLDGTTQLYYLYKNAVSSVSKYKITYNFK